MSPYAPPSFATRRQELPISLPIVTLTALAMAGARGRCLAAGANVYLSKPVSLKFAHGNDQQHAQSQEEDVGGPANGAESLSVAVPHGGVLAPEPLKAKIVSSSAHPTCPGYAPSVVCCWARVLSGPEGKE